MSFDFDAPEDMQGASNRISEPGTYHLVVSEVKDGQGPSGSPIDGFSFSCECVAGTAKDYSGKTHTETLFAPNLTKSEDNQLMSRRKLAAFFIAADLMTPEQLGKSVKIDLEKSVGRQIVMKVERQMDKNPETGKWDVPGKYVQLSYSDIFHVDDPDVKDIPKSADALSLIPKELRHEASWFAFKAKKTGQSNRQPVEAGTGDSFDDL